jgi:hypothetical protein
VRWQLWPAPLSMAYLYVPASRFPVTPIGILPSMLSRLPMLTGLPASLAVVAALAAGCGSSTTVTKTASVPTPTTPPATNLNTATALTPNTSTTGTQPTASCGSVSGGFAFQITGSGVSCATAQAVANAYVNSIQGNGQSAQGAVTVSAANTQFSCTSTFQGQTGTVTCNAPGNQGVVVFKTHP